MAAMRTGQVETPRALAASHLIAKVLHPGSEFILSETIIVHRFDEVYRKVINYKNISHNR
jgi:hypothetical protein